MNFKKSVCFVVMFFVFAAFALVSERSNPKADPVVSGTVTIGGAPLPGAVITFSHDNRVAFTGPDGTYSYTIEHGATTTTLTPSAAGCSFNEAPITLTDLHADVPNQNFTVRHRVGVSITSPATRSTVKGSLLIEAATTTFTPDVAKVAFYVDGTVVGQDTTAPYQYSWNSATVPDGAHQLKAMVVHSSGVKNQHRVVVDVNNSQADPHLAFSKDQLNFGSVVGGTYTAKQGMYIRNSGGGTLNWTAASSEAWLQATASGAQNDMLTVNVDPTGLAAGTYTGTVTLTDAYADNSPAVVNVNLNVVGADAPPFGAFEYPLDNSTVAGGVPFTGWALDDVEINTVKLYRDPVSGEGDDPILLGSPPNTAVFVEGTRPELAQAYPNYPNNTAAGWGYQVQTKYFPNDGNGTFVVTAKGTDSGGNEVVLGSKTIICDNASSPKPFGRIDTPYQGQTIPSNAPPLNIPTNALVFGWALTPQPNYMPYDGSGILAWIDGVPIGQPAYGQHRQRVSVTFAGLKNSDGAGGYIGFDTTAYMNGVHTLAWSARDSAGNEDGIGSRYFTIQNPPGGNRAGVNSEKGIKQKYLSKSMILKAMHSNDRVRVNKRFDRNAPGKDVFPDARGIINVRLKKGERLELKLTPEAGPDFASYTYGAMMFGKKRNQLPVGSTLNNLDGVFCWQPGPAFLGEYRFIFVNKDNTGRLTKKLVNVLIQ